MRGRVETIEQSKMLETSTFKILSVGEGVISSCCTRIKISGTRYIQFIDSIATVCLPADWPEKVAGRKAKFVLVAKEVN